LAWHAGKVVPLAERVEADDVARAARPPIGPGREAIGADEARLRPARGEDASGVTIPVVDIGPYRVGDRTDGRHVVEAVAAGCAESGLFLVTGHGLPETLVRRLFEVSAEFFALPVEDKLRWRAADTAEPRGYMPFATKNLGRTYGVETPPDLREQFFVGPLDDWSDHFQAFPGARRFYGRNIWPDRPGRFREVFAEFYRAQEALARDLMRIFALALGLPEGWFHDRIDRHFSTCPTNYYPEPAREPLPGQLRTGPHTDFGSLTILCVDDAPGGLQVLLPGGEWRDVRPGPGQLVVNLGDMMARWTNDRWRSAVHRVANPPRERAAVSRRQTAGFFLHPNYDAEVAPLPSCCDPDRPPRYAPALAGELIRAKLERRHDPAAAPA
jgi:isopenicillin N synthase-like dioxygenase